MRIDIGALLQEKGSKLQVEGEETFPPDEFVLQGPLRLKLTLTNLGRGILAEGSVTGAVSLSCGICLSDFAFPIQAALSEEYVPENQAAALHREEALEELSIFTYGDDRVLDLSEAVRQTVLLGLPMQPVCRPGCEGLCPRCGANRNEGDCGCPLETVEDRWEPLKALRIPVSRQKKRRNPHAKS